MTPLHALDGKPAPAELGDGLAALERLGPDARGRLAELVLPTLEAMPDDQLDNRIGRLCRRHELNPDVAGSAIKATRVLLRAAAACDLDADALAEDLKALAVAPSIAELLLPIYQQAKPELRREIAHAAILGHGKILVGLEWRMDTIGSSNAGRNINIPVVLLTLTTKDRNGIEATTVQMTPDMVQALRELCNELLGK